MNHHSIAAEACLDSFFTRTKKEAVGAVHAPLAASVAHQLTGLMKLLNRVASAGL